MSNITFDQLVAAIPGDDLQTIAEGAAKFMPVLPDDEDERAFPVDIDLTPTT